MKIIPTEIKCSFKKSDCEKNWVYTNYNGETHVIYKWHPLQICKIDETNNTLNLVEEKKRPLIFSRRPRSFSGHSYFICGEGIPADLRAVNRSGRQNYFVPNGPRQRFM